MYLDGYSIDVRNNPSAVSENVDQFVEWPLLVEFDADDGYADEAAVQTVTDILNKLWECGLQAVASCDFEDELPWSGGLDRPAPLLSLPWSGNDDLPSVAYCWTWNFRRNREV